MPSLDDLSPFDLGRGYKLVFQRNAKDDAVRAVVKDSTGAIFVRGNVVNRAAAFSSKMSCLTSSYNYLWTSGKSSSLEYEEEDDDESEEDDEEEDDD